MHLRTRMNAALGLHGTLAAILVMGGLRLAAAEAAPARQEREQQLIQTLTGNGGWGEKDKACRELQVIGTPASVPALAALLADPQLSHIARCALEPMPSPEAGQALRAALAGTDGQVKVGIINSLGFRREAAALPDMVPLLKGGDLAIAAAAAAALGRSGTADTAPALAEFRAAAPAALRPVAAEASLLLAERLVDQGEGPAGARIYAELQGKDWPEHVRLGAFAGSLRAQPQEAVAAVIRAITGDDPVLRGTAIARIPSLEGESAATGIARELPRLAPETQELLIGVLADRGPAVREAILGVGKAATAAGVRAAAAKALGRIGDLSCVPWLVQVIATDEATAETAAQSLAVMSGEPVSAAIRQELGAAPLQARPLLMDVILRRQDGAAVDGLLQQARAEDAGVRRAAFRALAGLAQPDRLPALLECLLATPEDVSRTEAERMLTVVARRAEEGPARTAAVLTALGAQADAGRRCSLLRVLGGMGGPEALAAVRERLTATPDDERTAAVKALAAWPDSAAVEPLLGALGPGLTDPQRLLALRGLVRLLGAATDMAPDARVAAFRRAAEIATDPDSRKLLLGGLPAVAHPEALALATNWLADPAVSTEASLAAISLAETILGTDREAAVAAARRLATDAADAAVKDRAGRVLKRAEQFEDYAVGWLVSGPYSAPGKAGQQLFDTAFPPEEGDGGNAAWRILPPAGRPEQPWMLSLTEAAGGDQRALYLLTWVFSPKAGVVRLEAGVDDALKLWVNGLVVCGNNNSGAAVPAEEKADVAFGEGWNLLMAKILQHTGPCELCLRFRTLDGKAVEGLRVAPLHQVPGGALGPKADAAAAAPAKPAVPPVPKASLPAGAGASPVSFVMHRVGTVRSEACAVADMNADGKLDIVAGPCWYEAPNWAVHTFRALEGQVGEDGKGYYDDFMNAPLDVDGDGRLDVVTCCWFAKALRWYRQTDAPDGQWPMAVADENGNFETGALADVDGDGKALEVVPAVAQTCWYDLAKGPDGIQRLVRHDVDAKGRHFGSGTGDINGDGRPDLLRPDAWFEAPPDPRQGAWKEHAWALGDKDGGIDHLSVILVQDVDGDKLNDVITSNAHKYGIFWYRQIRAGETCRWEQHTIDDTWSQPHSLALSDLDGDGDLDLIAGKRFMAHNGGDPDETGPLGVYWYELQPGPQPQWTRHAITYGEGIGSGLNLCVADLDGDQDPDILVTGKWGGPVWFENKRR